MERESLLKALKVANTQFSRYYLNEKFEDVRFELMPIYERMIGQTWTVRLAMNNKSHKVYTVELVFAVRSTAYNGVTKSLVKQENLVKTIGPRKCEYLTSGCVYQLANNDHSAIFLLGRSARSVARCKLRRL